MKNLIKISSMLSLLIIACLLIGGCGNSAENFVQGNGKINVTVKDAGGTLLANVKIDVKVDSQTGRVVDTWTTDASGAHAFQETIGSDYYFTFTDVNSPVRFGTQNYPNKVTPELTNPQTVNVTMLP
ncbi:MAG: hypothetical protein PHD54_08365 [Desulfuromonadaceae bacterium]|nr:hypothetical protein [Desulfuromonadaceae bacterium]